MEKKAFRDAYIKFWLENGKRPVSIYTFCQQLEVSEATFYDNFASFQALEKDIWRSFFDETVAKLKDDEVYRGYSVREKLLAFYFLWVQQLRENRSFILLQREQFLRHEEFLTMGRHINKMGSLHDKLESFRSGFYEYIRDLIKQGYQSGEIKERKFISDQFVHGFWVQALFVLRYWVKDDSERFEMTDAAIEKAVNLSFQLIGSGTLDSILDFGKFMFARK